MKRIVVILCCLLFLYACARSSGDYDRGYADGYAAAMSEYSRATPDVTPAPTARVTPQPTTTPSGDFKVYISSSFTMHKKSTCSGMKNYIAMPYSIAKDYFTKKCGTCFK